MDNRRILINEFATFLGKEMQDCVEQDVGFNVLEEYHRIMILQSAPVRIVQDVLDILYSYNNKAEITIIGKERCHSFTNLYPDWVINIQPHDKRFDDQDFSLIDSTVEKYKPEAVLYFNNYVSSVDFSNVEHVLEPIEGSIPIYSYSYAQRELNFHKKLAYHLYGCIVYKDLVEWFRTFS